MTNRFEIDNLHLRIRSRFVSAAWVWWNQQFCSWAANAIFPCIEIDFFLDCGNDGDHHRAHLGNHVSTNDGRSRNNHSPQEDVPLGQVPMRGKFESTSVCDMSILSVACLQAQRQPSSTPMTVQIMISCNDHLGAKFIRKELPTCIWSYKKIVLTALSGTSVVYALLVPQMVTDCHFKVERSEWFLLPKRPGVQRSLSLTEWSLVVSLSRHFCRLRRRRSAIWYPWTPPASVVLHLESEKKKIADLNKHSTSSNSGKKTLKLKQVREARNAGRRFSIRFWTY